MDAILKKFLSRIEWEKATKKPKCPKSRIWTNGSRNYNKLDLTQYSTWRRCRSKQCSIVCAWGDGSKHGNSALAEKEILWETPTTTPAFGRSPKG